MMICRSQEYKRKYRIRTARQVVQRASVLNLSASSLPAHALFPPGVLTHLRCLSSDLARHGPAPQPLTCCTRFTTGVLRGVREIAFAAEAAMQPVMAAPAAAPPQQDAPAAGAGPAITPAAPAQPQAGVPLAQLPLAEGVELAGSWAQELLVRTDTLIAKIRPTKLSNERRKLIVEHVTGIIKRCFAPHEVRVTLLCVPAVTAINCNQLHRLRGGGSGVCRAAGGDAASLATSSLVVRPS